MRRDYVGLASIFLRLAMVPDAMFGSSDLRSQDEAGRNAIKNITGRILRSGDLLFLAPPHLHAGGCNTRQSL
jgi:hypothetical protein